MPPAARQGKPEYGANREPWLADRVVRRRERCAVADVVEKLRNRFRVDQARAKVRSDVRFLERNIRRLATAACEGHPRQCYDPFSYSRQHRGPAEPRGVCRYRRISMAADLSEYRRGSYT